MTKRRKVLQRERQIARAIQETIHKLDATREYRIVMFVDNDTALYDDAIKQALRFLF